MNIPRLTIAMGYIDDKLISEAVEYKRQPTKWYQITLRKWGAFAACLCIMIAVPIIINLIKQQHTDINDNESLTKLSLSEAQAYEPFGTYFPNIIADGYCLETEVHIYDGDVLGAIFINDATGDSLELRIAAKSQFGNVKTGTVLYRADGISSYIYVDCGEYIAYYSSSKCDLNTIKGFEVMLTSADYYFN